jgi:hypothetical protein
MQKGIRNGDNFSTKKWQQINEELAYRKLITNTKTLESENLANFLYKRKSKWEHQIDKIGNESIT